MLTLKCIVDNLIVVQHPGNTIRSYIQITSKYPKLT